MPRATKWPDPREDAWLAGLRLLSGHGLFRSFTDVDWVEVPRLARYQGYAQLTATGRISCHKLSTLDADEWAWAVAHLMLHRGLGHLDRDRIATGRPPDDAARAVDCLEVNRFLREARLGREPLPLPAELPRGDLVSLAEHWRREGIPDGLRHAGTAGFGADILRPEAHACEPIRPVDWKTRFAVDIARAAGDAVEVAGGARTSMTNAARARTRWELARRWFVSSYPLLGGLAARFTIVADAELARTWDISVAAVNASAAEIYGNPLASLTEAQWRFVLAHEMLHAALRHGERIGGRDPYLWNVAADFVINGWLQEMGVGDPPDD